MSRGNVDSSTSHTLTSFIKTFHPQSDAHINGHCPLVSHRSAPRDCCNMQRKKREAGKYKKKPSGVQCMLIKKRG